MLRQWKLHYEAVDAVILVQLLNLSKKFSLCDVTLIADEG